jgi:hypothetical protein
VVYLTEDVGVPGDFVDVTIDEAMGFDLVASPIVRSATLPVL